MTDIRILLHDAAPAPRAPLDVDALLTRRPRRWRVWVASALAVVAVGGGVAGTGALSPAGDGGTQLSTRRTTPAPAPDTDGGDRSGVDGDGSGGGGGAGVGQVLGRPAHGVVGVEPPGGASAGGSTSASSSSAGGAASEGCRVDHAAQRAVSIGPDGNGGLSAEETPSCTYLATRPGGYRGLGKFEIEIRRDGAVFRLSSRDGQCGPIGVIEAGDDVRVLLRKAANDPPEWYAEAGADISCG